MEMKTGNVFISRNQHKRREIASITKVMTCLVSLRLSSMFGIQLSTKTTVNRFSASKKGTSAKLLEGDVLELNDLLYGLMLPSGNDAA